MIRIGVLSDTHGYLDPAIASLFEGVDHILHAGDIGSPSLILELEKVAPVTAVFGNTDGEINFRETEILQLGGNRFLIHHIINPAMPDESIRARIERESPDVIIFGHTHRRLCQTLGKILYFNPGYAGKPRFRLPRSVAILTSDSNGITAEYVDL